MAKLRCAAILLAGVLAACSGGQTRGNPLQVPFDDEAGTKLAAFQRDWSPPRSLALPNVAIGVVNEHLLVGRTAGHPPWRFEHPIEGRPLIAGELVLTIGGGKLVALDAKNGEERWTVKAQGGLRGAGDDGSTTIVSIGSLTGAHSIVLAIRRDGRIVRQIYDRAVVGSPAVIDDFAFLPYGDRSVVIFDLVRGSEAARVISSEPVSRAFVVGGDVYFGEESAVRFDGHIVAARRKGGTRVALPTRAFPSAAPWMLPGSTALPPHATRHDRIRYYARPVDGKAPHFERYLLSYERLALGLEAPSGRTRWVQLSHDTFMGGTAAADSVALCDAGGSVRWLELDGGRELHRLALGSRVMACAVQSERAPGPRPAARVPSFSEQLYRAIAARDVRLVPMQLELLDDLAAIAGEDASRALIDLASAPSDGDDAGRRAIAGKAAELLARRKSGMAAMIAALEQAATPPAKRPLRRWLRWQTTPPAAPVAELARALAAQAETRAAPALARLLNHPALPRDTVETVAVALSSLATAAERRALTLFLARQGCLDGSARATLAAARALVRLGARDMVVRVATETCDHEAMRTSLLAVAASRP